MATMTSTRVRPACERRAKWPRAMGAPGVFVAIQSLIGLKRGRLR